MRHYSHMDGKQICALPFLSLGGSIPTFDGAEVDIGHSGVIEQCIF